MSKISTVYDFLTTELATLFPSKTLIPRPISVPDNSISFLRDGYNFYYAGKNFVDGQLKDINLSYDFIIIFTRELPRTDANPEPHKAAEKALLEDTFTVEKHFYDTDTISIPDDLDLVNVTPTTGTAEPIPGRNDFYEMRITITCRIREEY